MYFWFDHFHQPNWVLYVLISSSYTYAVCKWLHACPLPIGHRRRREQLSNRAGVSQIPHQVQPDASRLGGVLRGAEAGGRVRSSVHQSAARRAGSVTLEESVTRKVMHEAHTGSFRGPAGIGFEQLVPVPFPRVYFLEMRALRVEGASDTGRYLIFVVFSRRLRYFLGRRGGYRSRSLKRFETSFSTHGTRP